MRFGPATFVVQIGDVRTTARSATVNVEDIRSGEDDTQLIRVALYGHIIADLVVKKTGEVQGSVNFRGWVSSITASRINAILSAIGSKVRVGRSKGVGQTTSIETGASGAVDAHFPIPVTGRL